MTQLSVPSLTDEDVKFFHENGYLVVREFASRDQCEALMKRMDELVDQWDPEKDISVFTTDRQARTTDHYFLDSADKIHFFLEAKARDEQGRLRQAKHLSLNKVGHGLHVCDDVFRGFVNQIRIARAVKQLGLQSPDVPQTMFIFKQPHIGGEVCSHQDSTFLYTTPPTCLGMWFALEPAHKGNGCLWAIPGSHKDGVYQQFVRNPEWPEKPDAPLMVFKDLKERAPRTHEELLAQMQPIEMGVGDVLFIHGALDHMSFENTSDKSRRSFQIHLVEGHERAEWDKGNWQQYQKGKRFPKLENWDKV